MRLLNLSADGFRNLVDVAFEAHPRLNVFVGDNGEGKTNLLEAVHLAASLRPLKPLERARDLVRFGEDRGVVRADFDLEGPLPIEVVLEPRGRKATLAGKAVRDISQVASRIGVVAFTPDELTLVRGSPDVRRRALDRFAFGLAPSFADVARTYERALDRRNRVLKQHVVDSALLDAYTEPLALAGARLMKARAEALRVWQPRFAEAISDLTAGALVPALGYHSSLASEQALLGLDDETLRVRFVERLNSQREGERHRRTTLTGPHLDDLVISLEERRARHLASQGEARAIVLALKLAAVRVYAETRATAPLLLLDDVAGELDPKRAAYLFAAVDEVGTQTFVTVTHLGALPFTGEGARYQIGAGRIVERGGL